MPPIHFKLTGHNGITRKVTFQELPSWIELANKLHVLFDIPLDKVGVSYVDSDNDEITASSEEELQDYYQSLYKPTNAIKFNVVDITINRDNASQSNVIVPERQNSFGVGTDAFEIIEHAWQGLSAFDMARVPSEGLHAFVEVLSSDASGLAKDNETRTDFESEDAQSTVHPFSFADKGKQRERASSFGAASTVSVLGEEEPEKLPIHVADHNQRLSVQSQQGDNKEAEGISVQTTPKATSPQLETPAPEVAADDVPATENIDDPPLASFDDHPASNASATLSQDVAALLHSFTQVISSHPELSEGVRNIVSNATKGTYWQTHRDALSQAVSGLSQTVDPHQIEAEAGRRVANALGTIFRSLSSATNNTNTTDSSPQPPTNVQTTQSAPSNTGAGRGINSAANQYYWPNHSGGNRGPPHAPWWPYSGRFAPPPPPPPPPPPHGPFSPAFVHSQPASVFAPHLYPTPHQYHHHAAFSPPSGPPPPRQQSGPPTAPLQQAGESAQASQPGSQVPPTSNAQLPSDQQSAAANPQGPAPPLFGPPPPSAGTASMNNASHRAWPVRGRHPHHYRVSSNGGFYPTPLPPPIQASTPPPAAPPPPTAAPENTSSQPNLPISEPPRIQTYNPFYEPAHVDIKAGEQQLREGIEQAKRAYKAQKEAYRILREERKKEKERENKVFEELPAKIDIAALSLAQPPRASTSQLAGNASNDYDFSTVPGLPRRNHTHLGHGPNARRTEKKPEDLAARAQGRIAKRLADMGFSETSFPDLPAKIKTAMTVDSVITKEREDDVVTTLLEEMLARSGRLQSPVASGSKDLFSGGAWQ